MIIVLEKNVSFMQMTDIVSKIEDAGYEVHKSEGEERIVLGVIGNKPGLDARNIKNIPGVSKVFRADNPYKNAERSSADEKTVIELKNQKIGNGDLSLIAGPCAVESEEQLFEIAEEISKAGVTILRGGAFKPRSSPYSFQGLGIDGLKLLKRAGEKYNLSIITEALESHQVELIYPYTDVFQVGARNMYNYQLLKELGKTDKPVMLKRGISATIEEWLLSAEYILSGGNKNVFLCERGVRTFDNSLRFSFDISAIPVIKQKTHLPIFGDPSHATGESDMVAPIARAAVAAGVDGIMIEVHNNPLNALSDGAQALSLAQFISLANELKQIHSLVHGNVSTT